LVAVKEPVSEQNDKPALDEQTLQRLLEAAFVLQEHNRERQQVGLNLERQSDQLRERELAEPQQPDSSAREVPSAERAPISPRISAVTPAVTPGVTPAVTPKDEYTLTLARIVETRRQIQVRHLEFESAMALVAERATEITRSGGAAIGLLDGEKIRYCGTHGTLALPLNSEVAVEKALCSAPLRTGQVIRCADVNTEFLLDPEECQRRGIASLIAVPIYHDGAVAGALELYFARAQAFTEQDVHTSQLMAGLATEALARDEELTWTKSLASERAAMMEALEKLKPTLAALMGSATSRPAIPGEKFVCRKCGHELVGSEQFCGKCGAPRAGDYEPPSMQSKLASLWNLQQAKNEGKEGTPSNGSLPHAGAFSDSGKTEIEEPLPDEHQLLEMLAAANVKPDDEVADADPFTLQASALDEFKFEAEGEAEKKAEKTQETKVEVKPASDLPVKKKQAEAPAAQTALVKTALVKADGDWTSALKAREFLEQLAASRSRGAFANFWNARRGDVYLAVAVLLVAVVIRWGIWSNHSVGATGTPTTNSAAHHRPAPDADLTLFDKFLISMGLADPPETPEYKGNPDTQVWVDLHTALYYCPGTDLYGKTDSGKYTSQRDAQLDQFEPAYRKACD
jgi:GAF domain-containing protein